jgi:hypothetical protein
MGLTQVVQMGHISSVDQIERLIDESPSLHAWPDGRPANWSVAPQVLRYLHDCLEPGWTTLETGAGQTTLAFAIAGTHHVCITPDCTEAKLIRAYCAAHGIEDRVTFIHESSDVALASGRAVPEALDFVLIDGAHRFPFPIIDWHYTERRLRVGGIVAVDDFPMPSVRILHDFLMGEDEWELIKQFQVTSFFRRRRQTVSVWDWADQKINKPHLDRQARRIAAARRAQLAGRLFRRWRNPKASALRS